MVGRVSLKNKEMSHTFQHAYFTIWHDFSWHIKESRVEKTILFWMRNFNKGRRTALKPGSSSCSNAYILVFFSFQQEIKSSNTLFKIKDLKQSTLYCFTIRIELMTYLRFQLIGLQTVPECYRTTISGINLFLFFFLYDGTDVGHWVV